jgi:hypothetical protein
MRGRMALAMIGLLVVGVLWAQPCLAQVTTGNVFGTVKDSQGGVLPGATVVLTSETRGTKIAPTVTDATGDFVVPNVTADTYTVEVSMQGFKTLVRKGVAVSAGDRVQLGSLVLEVGTLTETVQVTGETPLVQASSGERSYVANLVQLENLPLAVGRNFALMASFAPGISGTSRVGGGGSTNYVMDGVSVVDTGNNSQMLQLNTEQIGEVKVLTANYQAEYGRSSGLQILAVTKSGTNAFRGSIYDYERQSDWNTNSWVNQKNGDPRPEDNQRDWGFLVGGPVGKPGGNNKLFFFFAQEFRPRSGGGTIARFRVPTELERRGNFSQTRDNTGNLFPYIRDYTTGLPCSASNTSGCFQDGGVLGKIPDSRLYAPGMAILNNPFWPFPNHTQAVGENYNYEATAPKYNYQSYQPSARIDYQPTSTIRLTGKFNGQNNGTYISGPFGAGWLPGYNDSIRSAPGYNWTTAWAFSGNWTINGTTFLEATYGRARNYLASMYVNDATNINNIGLANLPLLYPEARQIDQGYFGAQVLNSYQPVWYQNGTILLPPNWAWGNRIGCATTNNNSVSAPCIPNLQYPNALNTNPTYDVAINLTKVRGRHSFKGGFYLTHSFKAQNINIAMGALPFKSEMNFSEDSNNPYDAQFGYANAALGILSTYYQQSKFVEGDYVYNNREWYIQDNWKVTNRLTLDYGLRFANFQPQYDQYMHAANFFPDKWSLANAPVLYVPGCPGGVYPCATTRQAMDPRTSTLLGAGSASLIGFLVPGTGDPYQGLIQQGQQGTSKYGYEWPSVVVAPRFGGAYDLFGNQKVIIRGGAGIFHDRMQSDTVQNLVSDPPFSKGVTLKYVRLQDLTPGLTGPSPAPKIFTYRYKAGIPTSFQWVVGTQVALPWQSSVDISYVGQHAWNQMNPYVGIADMNTVDIGAAFLPANQDPTRAASSTPGATAVTTDLLRAYRGYGAISFQDTLYWRTYHSIQGSFTRRMSKGIQAGVSWTWSISDKGSTGLQPRYQHDANGQVSLRDDWDQYVKLMGNQGTPKHILKANWVWDFPNLSYGNSMGTRVLAAVLNDWVLSGVGTFTSGQPYSIGFSYRTAGQSINLTGSPDYPARIAIAGNASSLSGCGANQYRQFDATAFSGPTTGSVGLESGQYYMDGCNDHTIDLSVQRNFRFPKGVRLQFRVDAYNAFNTVVYSGRSTTVIYTSPTDQTVQNSQYLADGSLDPNKLTPRTAGFGAVTAAQALRTIQVSFRFSF